MLPSACFNHCPRCGASRSGAVSANPFRCTACGFVYYFNPTVAAAALIHNSQGQALFIRRAKDPGQGLLGWVGGFIDIGESAEEALRREIREEVGLEVGDLEFLCSRPNTYPYQGVSYPVVDLFFLTRCAEGQEARALDDVAGLVWEDPRSLDPARLAFVSMQEALRIYQRRNA